MFLIILLVKDDYTCDNHPFYWAKDSDPSALGYGLIILNEWVKQNRDRKSEVFLDLF